MLSAKQLEKIREWLERSQNPLFLFDNDIDGLASFLLLQRYIGRGKGVAIKSFPELNVSYARKLHELKPDVVFVLDKPIIDPAFVAIARQLGIPLIWIDHHEPQKMEDVVCINPLAGKPPTNEPVTYWCWKAIKEQPKEQWIAMLGCLGDWFLPDFTKDFASHYSDIFDRYSSPAQAIYETEFGRLIKILSFALKDRTSNVIKLLRFLITVKDPYSILREKKPEHAHKRYEQVAKKYEKLLEKAKARKDKLLYLQYGGTLSLSSEISNELYYLYPKKIVVVAYLKGNKANISLRGKLDMRKVVAAALRGIEGTGGGHKEACGSTVRVEDLPQFKENIRKYIKNTTLK